jgi:alkanesulfonate monooxygenase SsuD/methylene tetrahydromethanopterin reductase-like flavin-dependent oxidoreductase (luciferase family)
VTLGREADALSVLVEITPVVAQSDAAAEALLAELNGLGGAISGAVIVGGPERIADQLAAWVSAGAADGFVVRSATVPDQLAQFVERVIPELQRRGLARTEYPAATLRENLGLPAVPNRLVA